MRLIPSKLLKNLAYLLLGLLFVGCTLEKESGFNRFMQNVTAQYNIIFNANEVLRQKQESVSLTFIDNYGQILSVYQDTTPRTKTPDKTMESVITRGNTIISNKEQSHYIPDAYLLLGKANFWENNYFNAIEFFNYVIRSFPKNKDLVQESRTWKARAQMHLEQLHDADTTIDTALRNVFPKEKHTADVYATRLQYDIYTENYAEGEEMAAKAIKYTHEIDHRLRWTFILAQLEEIDHRSADAIKNYSRVVSSNASFEMAFNASLNRIRIEDKQNGSKLSRIDRLRRLLKNENNKEFIDQIYFQIGEIYLAQNSYDEAIKNYKLSIRASTKNLNQKGLSYLRIADIEFKNKANYTMAKKYYDSTLTALSPNYPGFQTIRIKANNLQLLADRLQTIAREDTLQMLATLDDKARAAKITELVNRTIADQQAAVAQAAANKNNGINVQPTLLSGANSTSNFYFYNTAAIAQGNNDFKRIWGNRPLTDNWRLSTRQGTAANINPTVAAINQQANSTASPNQVNKAPVNPAIVKLQQDWIQNIPLTPAQLTKSNLKIYGAYLDIANFYRDVLQDNKEAIAIFELLLKRFPNNINKPSAYYNLYRLYSDIDPEKSESYKQLILKDYPESDFAKVILDPEYNQKLNDKNAAFTTAYTQLFELVAHRKYGEAAIKADEMDKQYAGDPFLAQVYYLRAIALGHSQKLDPFRAELQDILDKFPDDRLITPLIKQHMTFITANENDLMARQVVLTDADSTSIPFMQQIRVAMPPPYVPPVKPKQVVKPKPQDLAINKPKTQIAPTTSKTTQPTALPGLNLPRVKPDSVNFKRPDSTLAKLPDSSAMKPVVKEAPSIFSLRDSSNYYFVVNVNLQRVNLAPSRFGIGQFNRGTYKDNTIKHQVKPLKEYQLIYVGKFNSLASAKAYARAIVPLLPEIMTVPADKYTFFIITQENLDKLADKATVDSYFDFYQKHY